MPKGNLALVSWFSIHRPRCPFYGFSSITGSFVDSGGNQCALVRDRICPCDMEMQNLDPEWENCYLVPAGAKEAMINKLKKEQVWILQSEFSQGKSKFIGIDFQSWFRYVVNKD